MNNFVKFFSPGTFCAETDEISIDTWDIDKAIELSKTINQRYGAKPYAFQFINEKEKSGLYFINGIVESLEEIEAKNDPKDAILITNMKNNDWTHVVTTRTPYKWTEPFRIDVDCVVSALG